MYKKNILKNGVRIVTMPMAGTKTFTILVMVKTGSRHETKQNNGISHFVEHMFFKGTYKRPDTLAISSALDKIGGEFNAFTSKEYTGYYAKVDGSFAHVAADVIGDMMLNSKFETREIERERGVIIEEMNMYENNPLIHIDDLFEECLYGDNPAGWDTIGTKHNVSMFKRADFIKYLKYSYRGDNVVVGLAGNFSQADVAWIEKIFAKMPAGNGRAGYKNNTLQLSPKIKIKKQKTQQVNLSLGFRAYSYHHDDFYVAKVLGVILGGSMSSRLFISVRERKGLAYQVHTQVEGYADSGYLTTNIGTSPDKIYEAIKTTMREYRNITKNKVNADELKKAKDYIKGKTVIQLESSDNFNVWILKQELLHEQVLSIEQFFKKIDSVDITDIKRVASDIISSNNLNLAVIGYNIKADNLKPYLKI